MTRRWADAVCPQAEVGDSGPGQQSLRPGCQHLLGASCHGLMGSWSPPAGRQRGCRDSPLGVIVPVEDLHVPVLQPQVREAQPVGRGGGEGPSGVAKRPQEVDSAMLGSWPSGCTGSVSQRPPPCVCPGASAPLQHQASDSVPRSARPQARKAVVTLGTCQCLGRAEQGLQRAQA